MEQDLLLLLNSKLLWSVASAWILTQALKIVVTYLKEKKIKWRRFIEPGGMPSSHAAMVIALLTGVQIKEGISSTIFVVTLIFSLAIIYEAIGVRKEVGQQAQILNYMIKRMSLEKEFKKNLRERMGHEPLEVVVGSIIGLLTAIIWMKW
ncbi:MAG TPA: divergent PAP2 family protein [Candidatus Aerophobetes bacterium]|uniref:Divergent PAP2 family protein n=1 Tax=Aerophobetes bacterium TaxID=2030807 RepID=A0A7V0QTD5_UNCAE|nr:divergent PAP2 family protein [Candidatus Aerophobetes bacterium]